MYKDYEKQKHIELMKRRFDACKVAWQDLRTASKNWYEYIEGDQWDGSTVEQLTEEGKPFLTCNIILPIVLNILGLRLDNLYDVKAAPFEDGDEKVAAVITKLMRYFEYRSKLDFEFMRAFADAIISDIGGHIERIWTNEKDIRGEPLYRRVNPFFVMWDPQAEAIDMSDADFVFKTFWAGKDKIKQLFPEMGEEIEAECKVYDRSRGVLSGFWTRLMGSKDAEQDYVDEKNGMFRLIEMQERKYVHERVILDLDTDEVEEVTVSGKALDLYLQMNPNKQLVDRKRTEVYVSTLVAGRLLVQEPILADVQDGNFSIFPIWSYDFSGKKFGVVKNLQSYQDEHNKSRTYTLHVLKSMANSGWIIHSDSGVDVDELEIDGAKTGYVLKWGGDVWQKPEKIQPNNPPAGIELHDAKALEGAWMTSGASPNMRGEQESAGESGKLFQARVSQGLTIIKPMFEMQSFCLEAVGRDMISVIQEKMDYERTFRLVNPENGKTEDVQINQETIFGILNDVKVGKYDVVVVRGDNSETAKRQRFIEMYQMANVMPPELVRWDLILENSDFEKRDEWVSFIRGIMGQAAGANGGGAIRELPGQGQAQGTGQAQGMPVREMMRGLPEEVDKSVYLNR